jgi:hypothetical protein
MVSAVIAVPAAVARAPVLRLVLDMILQLENIIKAARRARSCLFIVCEGYEFKYIKKIGIIRFCESGS